MKIVAQEWTANQDLMRVLDVIDDQLSAECDRLLRSLVAPGSTRPGWWWRFHLVEWSYRSGLDPAGLRGLRMALREMDDEELGDFLGFFSGGEEVMESA